LKQSPDLIDVPQPRGRLDAYRHWPADAERLAAIPGRKTHLRQLGRNGDPLGRKWWGAA
jgi:hypothetical protein